MGIQVDASDVKNMLNSIMRDVADSWKDTHKHFREITPQRSGNAKRKTLHTSDKIRADYGYAGRLDEGYSRQAPSGMTGPSTNYFDREVDSIVRKYNGKRNQSSPNTRY